MRSKSPGRSSVFDDSFVKYRPDSRSPGQWRCKRPTRADQRDQVSTSERTNADDHSFPCGSSGGSAESTACLRSLAGGELLLAFVVELPSGVPGIDLPAQAGLDLSD